MTTVAMGVEEESTTNSAGIDADNDDAANIPEGEAKLDSQGTKEKMDSKADLKSVVAMAKAVETMDPSKAEAMLAKLVIYLDETMVITAFVKVWETLPGIAQRNLAGMGILGRAQETMMPALKFQPVIRKLVALGLIEVKGKDSAEVAGKDTKELKTVAFLVKFLVPLLTPIFPELAAIKPLIPAIDIAAKLAEKGDRSLAIVRAEVLKAREARKEVPEVEDKTHKGAEHADPIAVKPLAVRRDMSPWKKKAVRDAGLIGNSQEANL